VIYQDIYPKYLSTSSSNFSFRFPGLNGENDYVVAIRNATGTAGFTHLEVSNICVYAGNYIPPVPLPSGLYTPEMCRFGYSGMLAETGSYFTTENLAGDDFPIEVPCYIGRIWVHARTASGPGADTSIEIRINGEAVKTCVLPAEATGGSYFSGIEVYRPGQRLSVYGTGPPQSGPANIAVTVEKLNLTGG